MEDDTIPVIKAPVTFFIQDVRILRSRFGEDLWTFGNAKKNIAWTIELPVEGGEERWERFVEVIDVGNAYQPPHAESDPGQSGDISSIFRTLLPKWTTEYGLPLSIDMDDARVDWSAHYPAGHWQSWSLYKQDVLFPSDTMNGTFDVFRWESPVLLLVRIALANPEHRN